MYLNGQYDTVGHNPNISLAKWKKWIDKLIAEYGENMSLGTLNGEMVVYIENDAG